MNKQLLLIKPIIPDQILKNRGEMVLNNFLTVVCLILLMSIYDFRSSRKYERSISQISSFAFALLIYSVIVPDLVLLLDQGVWKTAP